MGNPGMSLTEMIKFENLDARKRLTQIIMRLLNEWQLSTAEQLTLLGLRQTSRNMLIRYRNLNSVIPYEQDKLERIGLLLAIYQMLHNLYPENKTIRETWIKRKNTQLNTQIPLEIMLEKGLFGMAYIMRFLDLQTVSLPKNMDFWRV